MQRPRLLESSRTGIGSEIVAVKVQLFGHMPMRVLVMANPGAAVACAMHHA